VISAGFFLPEPDGRRDFGFVLAPTLKRYEGIWFGWSGQVVPREQVTTKTIRHYHMRRVERQFEVRIVDLAAISTRRAEWNGLKHTTDDPLPLAPAPFAHPGQV
jgi:hypothetical protein